MVLKDLARRVREGEENRRTDSADNMHVTVTDSWQTLRLDLSITLIHRVVHCLDSTTLLARWKRDFA